MQQPATKQQRWQCQANLLLKVCDVWGLYQAINKVSKRKHVLLRGTKSHKMCWTCAVPSKNATGMIRSSTAVIAATPLHPPHPLPFTQYTALKLRFRHLLLPRQCGFSCSSSSSLAERRVPAALTSHFWKEHLQLKGGRDRGRRGKGSCKKHGQTRTRADGAVWIKREKKLLRRDQEPLFDSHIYGFQWPLKTLNAYKDLLDLFIYHIHYTSLTLLCFKNK